MSAIYTAEVTSSGDGRNGAVTSSDGLIDFPVAAPRELGGAGGATNPEQLFAAGFAACFHSAMRLVARRQKLDLGDSTVTAKVGLVRATDRPALGLTVTLEVAVPTLDAAAVTALTDAAEQVCPYSNAVRGNVDVRVVHG
ncbi:organic hydroperoxide resistance protein [Catenuloplanes atrovinosus]|uniref:Ohr subfamily peroxiredoxin n=1 Tax=Catenuloplanes atrovinosus TaxID=137266 RepID=A0AAE3YK53_9ACTN|nr:organic hydroperoxide resistance protein [Catenuloplanes atrovinosus]MDR7273940.1 Ohr subfamily peroxiredoxin [Catenuloplanes atrovinosus]